MFDFLDTIYNVKMYSFDLHLSVITLIMVSKMDLTPHQCTPFIPVYQIRKEIVQ